MSVAALQYILQTWEDSTLTQGVDKYYLDDQENGIFCKLRSINLGDTNKRAFDTEEVVVPLATIHRNDYVHGRDFLVRPDTENRKDIMVYL